VFLVSALAGGAGLNLVAASHLVLMDGSWNPAVDKQALARVWRDGQRRHTHIYRLCCSHTIEEKIIQRQVHKEQYGDLVSGDAVDGGSGGDAGVKGPALSKAELKELFTMDPASGVLCDTWRVMNAAAQHRDGSRRTPKRRGAVGSDEDGDEEGEGKDVGEGGSVGAAWPAYDGVPPAAGVAFRTAAGAIGADAVTYVHVRVLNAHNATADSEALEVAAAPPAPVKAATKVAPAPPHRTASTASADVLDLDESTSPARPAVPSSDATRSTVASSTARPLHADSDDEADEDEVPLSVLLARRGSGGGGGGGGMAEVRAT